MKNGSLSISYHEGSTRELTSQEEEELASLLAPLDIGVKFDNFEDRRQLSRRLSLISLGDVVQLMVIIGGSLVAKTLLQEVIKDLYKYCKNRLAQRKDEATFAVILDLDCEGRRYHVGVDFEDEATLAIGFFRLHAYLAANRAEEQEGGELKKIEYPRADDFRNFITICMPVAFIVSAVLVGYLMRNLLGDYLYFWRGSRQVTEVAGSGKFALWMFVWFILTALMSSALVGAIEVLVGYLQKRRYRKRFLAHATKWVLEVEALPGAPDRASIQVRIGHGSDQYQ